MSPKCESFTVRVSIVLNSAGTVKFGHRSGIRVEWILWSARLYRNASLHVAIFFSARHGVSGECVRRKFCHREFVGRIVEHPSQFLNRLRGNDSHAASASVLQARCEISVRRSGREMRRCLNCLGTRRRGRRCAARELEGLLPRPVGKGGGMNAGPESGARCRNH